MSLKPILLLETLKIHTKKHYKGVIILQIFLIQFFLYLFIINISRNIYIRISLLTIVNLAILSNNSSDFAFYISQSLSNFKMNSIIIDVCFFFLILYGINEIISLTNISKSVDSFLGKLSKKVEALVLLIFSMFSSNFDFSASRVVNYKNFYSDGFMMGSLNLISLLSIEILIIISFVNSELQYMWFNFFVLNFFVILWFFKKLINIYTGTNKSYKVKKTYLFFKELDDYTVRFSYHDKYNITKTHLILSIVFNIFITFIVFYTLRTYVEIILSPLVYMNILLFLFFIELFIYMIFVIYENENLKESAFYKKILSSYKNSFSHLSFLFMSLIFLNTNNLIYNNFLNVNENFSFSTFIILFIFITLITIISSTYILPLTFAIPITLILSNNDIIIFAFFISYIIILFFYKNLTFKSINRFIIYEILFVFISGFTCFLIAFFINISVSYMFLGLIIIILFTTNKLSSKEINA